MTTNEESPIKTSTNQRERRLRLSPGSIHFDLTSGCTAELLNGALLDLGMPLDVVTQAFQQLGMEHLVAVHRNEASGKTFGSFLDFVHESGMSISTLPLFEGSSRRWVSSLRKRALRWDHAETELPQSSPVEEKADLPENEPPSQFEIHREEVSAASGWFRGKHTTFEALLEQIKRAELPPIPSALALKAITLLADAYRQSRGDDPGDFYLDSERSIQILCNAVAFSLLIAELDPIEVSATRLPLSWPASGAVGVDTDEKGVILALVQDLPTYEQEWPAPYSDALGIALIKSTASYFGPRGESRLLQSGVGVAKTFAEPKLIARALWCEPAVISTRTVEGPSATPKVLPLLQIRGLLGAGVDLPELIRRISGLNARTIFTSQVMEHGTYPRTCLTAVAPYADADKIIEMLLVMGEAAEVSASFVDQHALSRRTVSVPWGRGQKQQQCRVIEWIWGEKILRAEPLSTDLTALVNATGFAQEVIRGDVLMSWKKWRGFE